MYPLIEVSSEEEITVKYDQERYCNVSATEIRCNAYLSKSSPPTLFTFGMQTTEVSESELFFKVTAETSIVDTNPINNVHTVVGPKKITPYSSSSEDDSTESDDSNLNSSLSIDPNVKYCGPDFTAVLLEELKIGRAHV